MATLTYQGTLSFPLGDEASPPSTPFSFSLVYTQRNVDDLVFGGAVTDEDIMGKVVDAKAVYMECLTGGGSFKMNTGGAVPLKPGSGSMCWFNPDGGLTVLTLTTTAASSFRLYMFS